MNHDHIPTSEVKQDILDTQREISQMEKEIIAYELLGDKMSMIRVASRRSGIFERKEFIRKLESILENRVDPTSK